MTLGKPTIAMCCADTARHHDASILAQRVSLPLFDSADDRFDFLLTYTAQRLELRKTGRGAPGPVYADFVRGSVGYRRAHSHGRQQPLAKAIGLRGPIKRYVIDATAGLGRDAVVLAMLGCRVSMLERSPIVHALLADALERARSDPSLASLCERLVLHCKDAVPYLSVLPAEDRPHVIYLDPMYPHRLHSALNKKEMRGLREVVGNDEDAAELLAAALAAATSRVVVKRPRLAPVLEGPEPTVQLRGESTRYDVYVVRAGYRQVEVPARFARCSLS